MPNIDSYSLDNFGIEVSSGNVTKSIQRGVGTLTTGTTLDVTISAIDVTKSVATITHANASNYASDTLVAIEILNSTTIRIYINTSPSNLVYFAWQVIEFNNVKSLQKGNNIIDSYQAEKTVTISSIDANKSLLFFSFDCSVASSQFSLAHCRGCISNSTTLSFLGYGNGYKCYWQVIEFN